jgi:hypothetical protein
MNDQQIAGILSNWDKVEADIRTGLHDNFGKSKDIQDILDIIHNLQVTANTVSPLRKLFEKHTHDMENPHAITISLGEMELLAIMYNLYTTRFGVDMNIKDFGYALINIKRFATRADVDNNTNVDNIINVDVMDYMIEKHNQALDAHEHLFRYRLPGKPPISPPADVFEPNIAISNLFVVERDCPMNYHDINGRVKTVDNNRLAVDYSYGKPACPIFGPHRNILLNSKILTDVSLHGGVRNAGSDLFILTPTDDTNFLLFQENIINGKHGFNDVLPEGITGINTYLIYVYPLDRSKLIINVLSNTTEIVGSALYDCDEETTQVIGQIDNLFADIQSLPNGWYRCSVTFDASKYNVTSFDVNTINEINPLDPFNIYYQGVVCNAMGFWQHQITKTSLPVPPVFTENVPITVLGTKIKRSFINIFNPVKGAFVIRYLSPMSERFGTSSAILRLGQNDPEFKTAISVTTNPVNRKRNRITTYNVNDIVLSIIDSEEYSYDDPQFAKRIAFTYGLGYQGFGFTNQKPKIFATSVDDVIEQLNTFFTDIYDGSGTNVGTRILQIPQTIIEETDTDDTLVTKTLANTPQYRLNMDVDVLELGYDSTTDQYLEGYLLSFKYYSVFCSLLNLEFLLDQYIPE